jgi:hypothetical protein
MKSKHFATLLAVLLALVAAPTWALETVRVMVVWSATAYSHAAGEPGPAEIEAVSATYAQSPNLALALSNSNTRFTYAGQMTIKSSSLEDSLTTDLNAAYYYGVLNTSDWKYYRDLYRADLTLLLFYKPSQSLIAGKVYQIRAPYNQALTGINLGVGSSWFWGKPYVIAHELAHLLGAHHQRSGGPTGTDDNTDTVGANMHGFYNVNVATNVPGQSQWDQHWQYEIPQTYPWAYDPSRNVCEGDIMTNQRTGVDCSYVDLPEQFSGQYNRAELLSGGPWQSGNFAQPYGYPGPAKTIPMGDSSNDVVTGLDAYAPTAAAYHCVHESPFTNCLWAHWNKPWAVRAVLRLLGL